MTRSLPGRVHRSSAVLFKAKQGIDKLSGDKAQLLDEKEILLLNRKHLFADEICLT